MAACLPGVATAFDQCRSRMTAPVSAHWLGHAPGSHAPDRGATLPQVQSILGHANVATTSGTYAPGRGTPLLSATLCQRSLLSPPKRKGASKRSHLGRQCGNGFVFSRVTIIARTSACQANTSELPSASWFFVDVPGSTAASRYVGANAIVCGRRYEFAGAVSARLTSPGTSWRSGL